MRAVGVPAARVAGRGAAVPGVAGELAGLLLVLVVAVPLLFAGLGLDFLDPDEGLYASIAQTMAGGGDWVLPHYNGLPYLEKPPLLFWLAALALRAWPDESAVRLPAALAALATVLLAWRIGRRVYGAEAGVFAGLAVATSVGAALYVRKAGTDLLFVACLALAMYGFVRDLDRADRGGSRFLYMYLGAALGLLAKGLIGVAFPVIIAAASMAWLGRPAVRDLNLRRGLALFAVVALPWHALVAWREPAHFWFYLVDNQVLRFLGLRAFVEDDVPVSTITFLAATFIWLFPWSVFALDRPPVAPGARPGRGSAAPVLVVWVVVVVGFFALARLKHEYYALPALPAVAVLAGGVWAAGGRRLGRSLILGAIGCVAVGAAAFWLGSRLTSGQALDGLAELNAYYRILRDQGLPFPFVSVAPFAALLQALGATLALGWALAALCWGRGWRRTAFTAVAGVGVVIAVLVLELLAVVEPHHTSRPVAEAIGAVARADDLVVHEGPLEYSAALPFYTGRRIAVVNGARGDQDYASALPGARGWFLDDRALAERWAGERRIFLVTQRWHGRSAVDLLPGEAVHELGRFGSRWLYSNMRNAP